MTVYTRIGALVPKQIRKKITREISYAGLTVETQRFLGFVILEVLVLSILISYSLYAFLSWAMPLTFAVIMIIFIAVIYYWFNSMIEGKARFVESVLPDALQLVSSNIKAGLTTERALFISARPEFGILGDELKDASKRIIGGQGLSEALLEISKKIKSLTLKRTMELIVQGIKSGGQIAPLLVNLGIDLREENAVKQEIAASVSMYVLMIFVAAAFGAPVLFGISSIIVGTIAEQTASIEMPSEVGTMAGKGVIPVTALVGKPTSMITPEFVAFFCEIALVVTAIFSALTIGVIATGREVNGMKYVPVIIIIGFALFFAVRMVLGGFLGGIATGL